jgi:hypothetical protein
MPSGPPLPLAHLRCSLGCSLYLGLAHEPPFLAFHCERLTPGRFGIELNRQEVLAGAGRDRQATAGGVDVHSPVERR